MRATRFTAAQTMEAWRRNYPRLKAFRAEHGHVDVPIGGRTESLRQWLALENWHAQSPGYSQKRRELLEAQGYVFTARTENMRLWQLRIDQLRRYIEEHSTWRVGMDEPDLRIWIYAVRKRARDGLLPANLVTDLETLGVPIALLPSSAKRDSSVRKIPVPPGETYGSDWDEAQGDRPR